MQAIKISLYLLAFVFSNFIILWFGAKGLIFTSLFLIPFDFVLRCMFHEQWKGKELILKLGTLVIVASFITYLINKQSINIALGSAFGFISAQIVAGIFYQTFIKSNYFIKVNGSDLIGIISDSIVFQLIAFSFVDIKISIGQILLKMLGGLFWYWVIFKKLKLYKNEN
jgi:uncharacterized PurR-regulated membrane protein YhhQ (DUF165 family)